MAGGIPSRTGVPQRDARRRRRQTPVHARNSPVIEQVRVLKPDVVDPHYLAAMLSGSWNTRFLAVGPLQRAKIIDLEIPLMPMDDQQRLAAALAEVERLRTAADTIVESSDALSSSLLDAVRFNIDLSAGVEN